MDASFTKKLLALFSILLLLSTNAQARQEWVYSVIDGDTLSEFSQKHLYRTSYWKQLQVINNIKDPKKIPIGTKLRVPLKWIRVQPSAAQVSALQGQVRLYNSDGSNYTQAEIGDSLRLGDKLQTGEQSSALILFADGSSINVFENSAVNFNHLRKYGDTGMVDSRVQLTQGSMETKVQPQRGDGARFEIHTPAAISAVRGTRFRSSYVDQESTARVEVLSGGVAVKGARKTRLIKGGYGTRVEKHKAPLPPKKLLPEPELAEIPNPIEQIGMNLRWQDVKEAKRYRVLLSEFSDFKTILWQNTTDRPVITLPDMADATYYLSVRAIDKYGIEGKSRHQTFTLNARPQPPFPVKPDQKAVIRGETPELHWTLSEDAEQYAVQIATDKSFTNVIEQRSQINGNKYRTANMEPTQTYYWRLASIASDGEQGPYSAIRTALVKPMPVIPEPALEEDETSVKLSWASAQPGQSFQVQVAHDKHFERVISDNNVTTPNITLERPTGFQYVRVRTLDDDGFAGAWGATQELQPPPSDSWYYYFGSFIFMILLI